jgi:cobalt/nickel transport system ATP-binding protein
MSPSMRGIVLDGVSAGYPDRAVLTGVELTLGCRRVALLGANGSGKTTLLRVLSGAHKVSAGRILLDGIPVRHDRKGLSAHRRRVQLVRQDPDEQLFSADVTRDVSFGPMNLGLAEADVADRVRNTLAMLSIGHLGDRPTHQLSHGERKRVALAGAVAMEPTLLLLDEPTAGLDPEGVSELLEVLDRLVTGGTRLVLATHDVELALAWAEEVVVLAPDGPVHGEPTAVLDDARLLAAARLHRPWPLELTGRLAAAGLIPGGPRPRNLDEIETLLRVVRRVLPADGQC